MIIVFLFFRSVCGGCVDLKLVSDISRMYFRGWQVNNNERLALADRVQKKLQKKHQNFRLICSRDKIEKEFRHKEEKPRS